MFGALKYFAETRRVRNSFRHIHGPASFECGAEDFSVFALVRDGEAYVEEFIRHYQSLGAVNITLLDNGSKDGTKQLAAAHDRVSVYSTDLPFMTYEAAMRRVFLQHHRKNQWVVAVDIDEFLDFPGAPQRSLSELLAYLNQHRYNAVTACMIDYMPVGSEVDGLALDRRQGRYITRLDGIRLEPYPTAWMTIGNRLPDPPVPSYSGGIREQLAGADGLLLLKHPLVKIDGEVIPFAHPHACHKGKLADVSLALHHYKFAGAFLNKIRQVALGPDGGSKWGVENRRYLDYFESQDSGQVLTGTLLEQECTAEVLCAAGLMQGGRFHPS